MRCLFIIKWRAFQIVRTQHRKSIIFPALQTSLQRRERSWRIQLAAGLTANIYLADPCPCPFHPYAFQWAHQPTLLQHVPTSTLLLLPYFKVLTSLPAVSVSAFQCTHRSSPLPDVPTCAARAPLPFPSMFRHACSLLPNQNVSSNLSAF